MLPWQVSTAVSIPPQQGDCTNDIEHQWAGQHDTWHGGASDNWMGSHLATEPDAMLSTQEEIYRLLIGVLLIVGRWMRVATMACSLMLLVFFGLMVRAHLKGMEINCGCFGPGEAISWRTLLRDGAMVAGSLLLTVMTLMRKRV